MLDTNMSSKNILVTGATSGIGETIARQFAQSGAKVIAVGRNEAKLAALHQEFPECIHPFVYDLMDLEHIEDIFGYCKENGLKLDGFIHCAGVVYNTTIKVSGIDEIEQTMKINCFSFLELGKYFSRKKYSKDGSSIIAISSISSLNNSKGLSQYAASKAAVNSLVKTMSKEFAGRKIRVNAILPANVETPMFRKTINEVEGFIEYSEEKQPLGFIEPEQIGYLAEFLMSDNARFMTGELVVVSGGMEY